MQSRMVGVALSAVVGAVALNMTAASAGVAHSVRVFPIAVSNEDVAILGESSGDVLGCPNGHTCTPGATSMLVAKVPTDSIPGFGLVGAACVPEAIQYETIYVDPRIDASGVPYTAQWSSGSITVGCDATGIVAIPSP